MYWPPKHVVIRVGVISVVVVSLILSLEYFCVTDGLKHCKATEGRSRVKRTVLSSTTLNDCYGQSILQVQYPKGSATTLKLPICSIFECEDTRILPADFYVCPCVYPTGCWTCEWANVLLYSGSWNPSMTAYPTEYVSWWKNNATLVKGGIDLLLTFRMIETWYRLAYYPMGAMYFDHVTDPMYVLMLAEVKGKDPIRVLQLTLTDGLESDVMTTDNAPSLSDPRPVKMHVDSVDYTSLTPMDVITMSTGYTESNIWLEWLAEAASQASLSECVACAAARPTLYTQPAPLVPQDEWGFQCMLSLTKTQKNENCITLSQLFPPITDKATIGSFTPAERHDYYCFNFTSDSTNQIKMGQIQSDWCNITQQNGTDDTRVGKVARAELYYFCGERRLHIQIPQDSVGLCALVRLAASLTLVGPRMEVLNDSSVPHNRKERSTNAFDPTVGSPTYIDAIGVPRGVPDEYKLVNQIAAGFEHMPIISYFFPILPHKNVDRINYIHYNVMRLSNLTRDAVEGLAEQLAPTSLMAVQNRMALDMLLAEKGGLCSMFGELCCSFIPNNTAPDGKVTRALEGLRTLSDEMKSHSGLDNPFDEWLLSVFGPWKQLIVSMLMSIAVFVAILITCGCCCIPCLRSLTVRLITSTLEKRDPGIAHQLLMHKGYDLSDFEMKPRRRKETQASA